MVDYVSDSRILNDKILTIAYDPNTNEDLANALKSIPGVEADRISNAPEILYAYRDVLTDDQLRVMAELWVYANEHGWTTVTDGAKGTSNRAERIIENTRKDLGEITGEVDLAEAPVPQINRREGYDWRNLPETPPEEEPVAPPEE